MKKGPAWQNKHRSDISRADGWTQPQAKHCYYNNN
jgi:hypothetical protein